MVWAFRLKSYFQRENWGDSSISDKMTRLQKGSKGIWKLSSVSSKKLRPKYNYLCEMAGHDILQVESADCRKYMEPIQVMSCAVFIIKVAIILLEYSKSSIFIIYIYYMYFFGKRNQAIQISTNKMNCIANKRNFILFAPLACQSLPSRCFDIFHIFIRH